MKVECNQREGMVRYARGRSDEGVQGRHGIHDENGCQLTGFLGLLRLRESVAHISAHT